MPRATISPPTKISTPDPTTSGSAAGTPCEEAYWAMPLRWPMCPVEPEPRKMSANKILPMSAMMSMLPPDKGKLHDAGKLEVKVAVAIIAYAIEPRASLRSCGPPFPAMPCARVKLAGDPGRVLPA